MSTSLPPAANVSPERVVLAQRSLPPPRSDVFDDPEEYATLCDGFSPANIGAAVVFALVASALAFGPHRALTGTWSHLGGAGVALAFVCLLVASTLTVAVRAPLMARDRARFWRMLTLQGAAHLTWLYVLGLLVGGFFAPLAIAILVAWIFNDTRYLYDSALLRRQYLAPALAVDAGLALGWWLAPAMVARLLPDRGAVVSFAAVQAGLTLLAQGLIVTVGKQNAERAQRAREMAELSREVAVFQKEREVFERAARLMTTGLATVKFAHDVASPLTALDLALTEIRRVRDERLRVGESLDAESLEILDDMSAIALEARSRLHTMADEHATALRRREPLAPVSIGSLLREAWDEARATVETHGVQHVATPRFEFEACEVMAAAGHRSTFANLLTNGALQRPDVPIEVRGAALNAWFYEVTLRDRGIAADERATALARIERSLALEDTDAHGTRKHRGYGIALGIARVLIVRYGGALSVRAPSEGDGVEFCAVLPRVMPDEIPDAQNHPAMLVRG